MTYFIHVRGGECVFTLIYGACGMKFQLRNEGMGVFVSLGRMKRPLEMEGIVVVVHPVRPNRTGEHCSTLKVVALITLCSINHSYRILEEDLATTVYEWTDRLPPPSEDLAVLTLMHAKRRTQQSSRGNEKNFESCSEGRGISLLVIFSRCSTSGEREHR